MISNDKPDVRASSLPFSLVQCPAVCSAFSQTWKSEIRRREDKREWNSGTEAWAGRMALWVKVLWWVSLEKSIFKSWISCLKKKADVVACVSIIPVPLKRKTMDDSDIGGTVSLKCQQSYKQLRPCCNMVDRENQPQSLVFWPLYVHVFTHI